jgi:hypothetical protein
VPLHTASTMPPAGGAPPRPSAANGAPGSTAPCHCRRGWEGVESKEEEREGRLEEEREGRLDGCAGGGREL